MASGTNGTSFLSGLLQDVRSGPWGKQLAYGVLGGWLSGYTCARVGRSAALGLGTSVLVLQLASRYGYIKIDWGRVQRELSTKVDDITEDVDVESAVSLGNKIRLFVADNLVVTSAFSGGFLLGLGSG